MTDNELLLAISNMMDEKLKNNLAPIENRLTNIENKVSTIEHRLTDVENRLANVESDTSTTKLLLENEIRVNIQRVAEGHLDLSRNMHEVMKPSNEIEMLAIKVRMLETDMREIKQKIS